MNSSIIKKFALETYGCQMNVADSELVEGILTNLGLEKTADYDEADAIFLNTCAIRENAETKVHSKLGNLHKIKLNNIYNFIHKPSLSLKKKFRLESGDFIVNPTIAYKTYGKLNKNKSNAI